MAGPEARPAVSVHVFVEGDEVTPVRIPLELFNVTEHGSPTVWTAQEDATEGYCQVEVNPPCLAPRMACSRRARVQYLVGR